MTNIFLEGGDHAVTHIPVVDPGAADGVFGLLWLVVALPLLGALVLLVGGPLTKGALDKRGHLLGAALPIGSFVISLVMFVSLLGREESERQVGQHLFTWFEAGDFTVGMDLLYDPLAALFLLLITGVGSLIHVYSIGYMEHDERRRRFFGYLNLFVAAMLMLILVGQLPRAVPRLGGRRPRVVPPHRLLAAQALRGRGRQEGLRPQPRRRRRPLARDRADVRHLRHHRLRRHQRGDR